LRHGKNHLSEEFINPRWLLIIGKGQDIRHLVLIPILPVEPVDGRIIAKDQVYLPWKLMDMLIYQRGNGPKWLEIFDSVFGSPEDVEFHGKQLQQTNKPG
jgi:hypothetical protein